MHLVILSILPKYCLIHLSYCYFTYKGQCEGFDEKLYLWLVGVAIVPDICKVPTFAWGLPIGNADVMCISQNPYSAYLSKQKKN